MLTPNSPINNPISPPKQIVYEPLWTVTNTILIASICSTLFGVYVLVSVLAPFIPIKIQDLGYSDFYTGLILALYPGVVVLTSVFLGYLIQVVGCMKVLIGGTVLLAAMTVSFGIFSDNLALLFIFRAGQGIGGSATASACFSLLAVWFPHRKSTVMSLAEATCGLAYMAGPALGGLLFSIGGFQLPFLVFGGFYAVLLPITITVLKTQKKGANVDAHFTESAQGAPSLWKVLNRSIIIAGLAIIISENAFGTIQPTLALFLIDNFGVTEPEAAYLFAVAAGSYALVAPFIGRATERFGSRVLMISGCLIMGVAFVFLGPFNFLKDIIADQTTIRWIVLIVALAFTGTGLSLMFVPTLPTMVESLQDQGIHGEGVISGLFGALCSAGQVFGPIIGSSLTAALDFETTCLIIGVSILAFTPALFLIPGTRPVSYHYYKLTEDLIAESVKSGQNGDKDYVTLPLTPSQSATSGGSVKQSPMLLSVRSSPAISPMIPSSRTLPRIINL